MRRAAPKSSPKKGKILSRVETNRIWFPLDCRKKPEKELIQEVLLSAYKGYYSNRLTKLERKLLKMELITLSRSKSNVRWGHNKIEITDKGLIY